MIVPTNPTVRSDSPPPPPPPSAPQTRTNASLPAPPTPIHKKNVRNSRNSSVASSMQQSMSAQTAAAGGVRLERVLGLTSTSSSDLSVNPITGHIAYPAGRIVVVYDSKETNQGMAFRYLTLKKRVSSLAWSACGTYLAVGERGRQPEITIWSIPEDEVTEIATPGRQRPRRRRRKANLVCSLQHHNFGVAALAFGTRGAGGDGPDSRASFDNWLLASAGFEHDHQIIVWKWMDRSIVGMARVTTKVTSMAFCPVTNTLVTVGLNHLSFWSHGGDMDTADESMRSISDPSISMSSNKTELTRSPVRKFNDEIKDENNTSTTVTTMKPRAAGVPPRFSSANFVGCCYDENGVCYVVTSTGTLCSVDSNKMMNKWVELDVKSAHSLSITQKDTSSKKGLLTIGCDKGVVRMFRPGTLQYVTTIATPLTLTDGSNTNNTKNTKNTNQQPIVPANVMSVGVTDTVVCVIDASRNLIVWDVTSPKKPRLHRSFSFHSDGVWDVAMPSATSSAMFRHFFDTDAALTLPSETFYTCGADGTVKVWNIDREGQASRKKKEKKNEKGMDGTKDINNDDEMLPDWYTSTSGDLVRTVCIVEATNNDKIEKAKNSTKTSNTSSSTTTTTTTKSSNNSTRAEQLISASSSSNHGSGGVRCMAVSPDGAHLATGDRTGTVRIHDLSNALKTIESLKRHTNEIMSIAYSPVPPPLADLGDSVGKRVPGRSHVEILAADDAAHRSLLVSAGRDRLVNVHDASPEGKYNLTNTLNDHSASVTAVRFAMDGSRLYSCGGDRTIVISRVKRRVDNSNGSNGSNSSNGSNGKDTIVDIKRGHAVTAQRGTIHDMRIHPNNRWVVTSGHESKVQIWSSFTGKKMRNWSPTDAPPRSHATSDATVNLYKMHLDATGTYAATCSFDRGLRIYDFLSGECLASFSGHSELVTAIHFTADDRRLISVGADGCVMVWRLPTSMTRAMRSRRAEIRRNCLLQLEREREGREEEEREEREMLLSTENVVENHHSDVVVATEVVSDKSLELGIVANEDANEDTNDDTVLTEDNIKITNTDTVSMKERERTLKMIEKSEKALAAMGSSSKAISTSPISTATLDIEPASDSTKNKTNTNTNGDTDDEWLRKSSDAIAACLPTPILEEDEIATIAPESTPITTIPTITNTTTANTTTANTTTANTTTTNTTTANTTSTTPSTSTATSTTATDLSADLSEIVTVTTTPEKDTLNGSESSVNTTPGLGRSDLPSWAMTNNTNTNGTTAGTGGLPAWAKTVTEMPPQPKSNISNKNNNKNIDNKNTNKKKENDPFVIVGVNRWAERRKVRGASELGRSLSGAFEMSGGSSRLNLRGSQSVPSSPTRTTLGHSQRNMLASSYEEADFVRIEEMEEQQQEQQQEQQDTTEDNKTDTTEDNTEDTKENVEENIKENIEEMKNGTKSAEESDIISTATEEQVQYQKDQLKANKEILPREKVNKIIEMEVGKKEEMKNAVNGVAKISEPNVAMASAAVSSSLRSSRASSLRTSSERSLHAERQALKLKERQKKTNDAVNNMRKRLVAMGIVKEDPVPISFTHTDTNKNTNKKNKKNKNPEFESFIQDQDKNEMENNSYDDEEEEEEVSILESSLGQSIKPTIDTMETLSGPKQSPVSPTRPKSNNSTRDNKDTPLVLQSLSHPVSDYRQSVQDLHSAVDKVLSMYAEINRAHTNLSQSFAGNNEEEDGISNWQQNIMADAEQTQELNAISGVLSDLKMGLSRANLKLEQATGTISIGTTSTTTRIGDTLSLEK